jgi:ketosteroid isomerase-like protein
VTATEAQERVLELMPRFFDALERGDVDAGMALTTDLTHPEIEFTSAIGTVIEGHVYRGRDELEAWFRDLVATFVVGFEDREFRAVGDRAVVACYRFRGHGRGSGIDLDQEIGVVWELEDGLIRRSRSFTSHVEALAAAEELRA